MTQIQQNAAPDVAATVVITTKNRKEELRTAIASCLKQTAPLEVLVIDDGSTDGTSELVRQEFPMVRLDRVEQSLGLIVQRNRGAALAAGRIIFSIDDDAAFVSTRTVEQTLADFDHPRVGAVAIPSVDVNRPLPPPRRVSPAEVNVLGRYIGCAHAVRKDVFLKLGGYREYLFHQGEESEFCTRMLAAGYITRLGRADEIHHYESPRRQTSRLFVYAARNNLLFAWYHVPLPQLLVHLAGVTVNQLRFGLKHRHPIWSLQGLLRGYSAIFHELSQRKPLPRPLYRLTRRLAGRDALALEEVEPLLPPLPAEQSVTR